MRTLPKYKQNLRIQGNDVWSYSTIVATISKKELHQNFNKEEKLGKWSQTTQKHINYVSEYMNLKLIKNES